MTNRTNGSPFPKTANELQPSESTSGNSTEYPIVEAQPSIFLRDNESLLESDDDTKQLATTQSIRSARDAFISTCKAEDLDYAELQFHACLRYLDDAWRCAKLRSQAFRDLLGTIEASLKFRAISDFSDSQRGLLQVAFFDLQSNFVDAEQVIRHITKFTEAGIDVTGPVFFKLPTSKVFKVSITQVDQDSSESGT